MQTENSTESRRAFLGALIGLPLIPAALLPLRAGDRAGGGRPAAILHPPSSGEGDAVALPIAGFRYYDGPAVLPQLQPGTPLTLRPEPDNPHDSHAVEILHAGAKLGYIPRFCNRQIRHLLQTDVPLTCEVAHVSHDAPPWEAVSIRVALSQPEYQEAA